MYGKGVEKSRVKINIVILSWLFKKETYIKLTLRNDSFIYSMLYNMLQHIIDNDLGLVQLFSSKSYIQRWIFDHFEWVHNKLLGIIWLRWTGKTFFLLHKRKNTPHSIYISCDNTFWLANSLFENIKELHKSYWYTTFFLDEIQEIPHREQELKHMYDFLDVRVIFSGSNMIDITRWWYDLSRRVVIRTMPLFSFGEYITITKKQVSQYTLDQILYNHQDIAREHMSRFTKTLFQDYLTYWQFGYIHESGSLFNEFQEKLQNSLKKSVFQDISKFVDISSNNLNKVRELIFFIAQAGTSDISVHWLAKKIMISDPTTDIYINFLARAGIIRIIDFYGNITDTIRKNKKYILPSTNIIKLFSDNSGCLRESFFISCLSKILSQDPSVKHKLSYQSQTDFVLELDGQTYFFEIGWKWKSRSDKGLFVVKDDILIGQWNIIPLWLFGLL